MTLVRRIRAAASARLSALVRSFRWDYYVAAAAPATSLPLFSFGTTTATSTATSTSWIASASPSSSVSFDPDTGLFTGTLRRREASSPAGGASSGTYAAARASVPYAARDCHAYEGLELAVRFHDDHVYALNVTAQSFFPDDLYQGFLKRGSGGGGGEIKDSDVWTRVVLPFDRLILTSYGYEKSIQREIHADALRTVGIAVMAEGGGVDLEDVSAVEAEREIPFKLEIGWIRAVPRVEVAEDGRRRGSDGGGGDDDDDTIASVAEAEILRRERIERSIARRRERQEAHQGSSS